MTEFLLQKGIRQEAVPAIEAVAADEDEGVEEVAARADIPAGPGTPYVLPTVYPQIKSIQQIRAIHHPCAHSPTASISHGGSILIDGGCVRMHSQTSPRYVQGAMGEFRLPRR